MLAHAADPTSVVEARLLVIFVLATRLADILTSAAVPGRLAALDIGVTGPDASGAGADCCDAMFNRKRADYAAHLDGLEAEGVVYKPMVWSCFGRAHPETDIML